MTDKLCARQPVRPGCVPFYTACPHFILFFLLFLTLSPPWTPLFFFLYQYFCSHLKCPYVRDCRRLHFERPAVTFWPNISRDWRAPLDVSWMNSFTFQGFCCLLSYSFFFFFLSVSTDVQCPFLQVDEWRFPQTARHNITGKIASWIMQTDISFSEFYSWGCWCMPFADRF